MRLKRKFKRGQAIVEYVVLLVVVVLTAILVLSAFSDRVRDMIRGVTGILGGDSDKGAKDSAQVLTELKPESKIDDLQ